MCKIYVKKLIYVKRLTFAKIRIKIRIVLNIGGCHETKVIETKRYGTSLHKIIR